jgi:NhaP-type Na+/H+ or K+/H+ antiporter
LGSAILITFGSRRHWITAGARRLGTLGAALSSFGVALAFDGNGFIGAFVAGIAFGAELDDEVVSVEKADDLPELLGDVLALAVWFLFGAALRPVVFKHFDMPSLVYALLSLTVVRLVPVAVSLLGSGLDRRTVLFVSWFGPRGLASAVFALLAVEELSETPLVLSAVGAVALTVSLSVVLHGISAGPLGSRYARFEQRQDDPNGAPRSRRPAVGNGDFQ